MAASLSTRTHFTDDDGSGTTGTIENEATLQAIYDNLDLLISGTGAYATLSLGGKLRIEGAGLQIKGAAAPSVSAAGEAVIYFDSTAKILMKSEDGGSFVPLSTFLDRATGDLVVNTTTTETDIASRVIAAGQLASVRGVRMTVRGVYKNTSGGNANLTFRAYFGATKIAEYVLVTSTGGSNIPFGFDTILNGNNATGTQRSMTAISLGVDGAAIANAAFSGLGVGSFLGWAPHSAIAEDSTLAKTLRMSIQWSVSNANNSVTRQSAFFEIL